MIVTAEEIIEHIRGDEVVDETAATRLGESAQSHIESLLGFAIEDEFETAHIPAALKQAVLMLCAHWYENRESVLVGLSVQQVPDGLWAIVNEHREWTVG